MLLFLIRHACCAIAVTREIERVLTLREIRLLKGYRSDYSTRDPSRQCQRRGRGTSRAVASMVEIDIWRDTI